LLEGVILETKLGPSPKSQAGTEPNMYFWSLI